jgi:hypothetical protein
MGYTPYRDIFRGIMENFGGAFESDYDPLAAARDVFEVWLELLRDETPWSEMYLDDVTGRWGPVIVELFNDRAAERPADRRRHLGRAAHRHGEFRRGQRFRPQDLTEEVDALQEAIGEVLDRIGAPPTLVEQTLHSLAPDLRCIGRAVHAGYVDGRSTGQVGSPFEELADPEE